MKQVNAVINFSLNFMAIHFMLAMVSNAINVDPDDGENQGIVKSSCIHFVTKSILEILFYFPLSILHKNLPNIYMLPVHKSLIDIEAITGQHSHGKLYLNYLNSYYEKTVSNSMVADAYFLPLITKTEVESPQRWEIVDKEIQRISKDMRCVASFL